ncbi:HEAT repeat domain-containing protein [Clostridium botulinum]|uniref:PBS lyase n=1 Tax=Clostridium botulinum C/D str. DC5 TaxID=1443128 RepID=A0A0A0II87_CLOBO|nr:HEAT repeat domain-containing protein [Clostridium botulinum]KEI03795.1 PBS lyase [Clostridium botulinum C/D str. BKT75002]KEI09003.1 PBS lyase [Clostridium botulinum C/D str. BKT2873]KGM93101.1 PBS lyase [Clostridium botulinum D str. CCUG 7971]KGM99270.1 PBS lyase [Clostridium botulinum C/D str. DC5]KOC50542.1 PBS lyase [Clostridium botulinum]
MKKGLVELDWNKIDKYSNEDITYFLFVEGKSIDSICKIRNIDRTTVQNHIIEGKIKYRFLTKSKDSKEFFATISKAGKADKIQVLASLNKENKIKLIKFIKNNYKDMYPKDKESAVWILGELKDIEGLDILMKASVHKFVNVRRMAVSAMGKLENTKCEVALIRALDDENAQVIMYSIKALEKIKSLRAKEKIMKIMNSTSKEYLKRAALIYIESIDNILNRKENEDK